MGSVISHRPNLLGKLFVPVQNFIEVDALRNLKSSSNQLLIRCQRSVETLELRIDQIGQPNAAARNLVLVARTDPSGGGANSRAVRSAFGDLLDCSVKREDDVGTIADSQLAFNVDSGLFQPRNFLKKRGRVDDHPISDDGHHVGSQDSTGDQFQDEFLSSDEHRVACVVAPLVASYRVKLLREQVDDLAFAFVSPLRPQNNQITHGFRSLLSKTYDCSAQVQKCYKSST